MSDTSTQTPLTLRLLARLATILRALAATLPVPGARLLRRRLGLGGLSDRRIRRALDLPVLTDNPSQAAIAPLRQHLQQLLAAGNWDGILDDLRDRDHRRAALPDGRREAAIGLDLLLEPLQAALDSPAEPSNTGTLLAGFRDRLAARPGDPVAATLTAEAEMAAGWAARGDGSANDVPEPAMRQFTRHFAAARAILDQFEPAEHASPLLARAHYRLCLGLPEGGERLRDAHDDRVDLDPSDMAAWEDHGIHLLPSWFGSHAEVAAAAARCEWQTERWLGRGGYALFLLPVLERDNGLWDRIDPDQLAAAIHDLARRRHRDQFAVNRLAAQLDRLSRHAPADYRPMLALSLRHLLQDSLNTLIPAAWDLSEPEARRRIAMAFLPEIRAGARFGATSAGLAQRNAPAG